MKKYNHSIKIVNESKEVELFEKYKERIKTTAENLAEIYFGFDIKLKIVILNLDDKINSIIDELGAGFSTKTNKTYIIGVSTESLRRIEYDNGLDLDLTLYHEFVHTYDLYYTLHNKYYKKNPLLVKKRTVADFVISTGWSFWTEFKAYYYTFKEFYEYHNYPTLLQMVKGYEKLKKDYENLVPILLNKYEGYEEKVDKFMYDLKSFIYGLSKHIAGVLGGKPKYYKYKESTKNKPEYKKLIRLCRTLSNRVIDLFINTYGKGMKNKLGRLGDYIIRQIYMDFNMIPKKEKGLVYFVQYF